MAGMYRSGAFRSSRGVLKWTGWPEDSERWTSLFQFYTIKVSIKVPCCQRETESIKASESQTNGPHQSTVGTCQTRSTDSTTHIIILHIIVHSCSHSLVQSTRPACRFGWSDFGECCQGLPPARDSSDAVQRVAVGRYRAAAGRLVVAGKLGSVGSRKWDLQLVVGSMAVVVGIVGMAAGSTVVGAVEVGVGCMARPGIVVHWHEHLLSVFSPPHSHPVDNYWRLAVGHNHHKSTRLPLVHFTLVSMIV